MPTDDNPLEPPGASYPRREELRQRLLMILADLDRLGDWMAAVHVQTAIDCLGTDRGRSEG